jgi:hypothetical protein
MRRAFKRLVKAGTVSEIEDSEELEADDPRAINFRNSLRPWFNHAPWEHVRVRELRSWLYWCIFNAHHPEDDADVPEHHVETINEAVELIKKCTGCVIEDGPSHPSVKPLLLTLDPVSVNSRPFVWYIFVAAANFWIRTSMSIKYGVQYGSYDGLEYVLLINVILKRPSGRC